MSDASFASLGPTLLARKGGAKPAMRPQLAPLTDDADTEQLEDLGWNDMGGDAPQADPQDSADIVAITANVEPQAANEDTPEQTLIGDSPMVRKQQTRLAKRLLDEDNADRVDSGSNEPARKKRSTKKKSAAAKPKAAKSKTAQTKSAPPKTTRSNQTAPRRAAFTLRLDADRHLKLRLAATMQGQSAQALVTQALDEMLGGDAELDALISQLNGRMKRN